MTGTHDPHGENGPKYDPPIRARCAASGCEVNTDVRYDRVTCRLLCAKHWLQVDPRDWGFVEQE